MKREPIVYFPQDTENRAKKEPTVGEIVQIGKPSSRYYENIHHSLKFNTHRLSDLQALLKFEGTAVKIISILKMNSGARIAVLHKKEGGGFLKNIEKLFANLDKAFDSRELKFY